MAGSKWRLGVRRMVAGVVAAAGLTAGVSVMSAPAASAQPALPPLPSSSEIIGLIDQATSLVGTVSGAIQSIQNLDFGSSSGLPLGSLGLGGVGRPASGPISQRFGGGHMGIDIAAPMRSPILAAADGVVIDSGPASGFGLWIRIRHNDGTVTTYGHNDVNFVKVGQRVSVGQQIGLVGSRGQSTGPHLHFEVDLPGWIKIDPIPWLAARGVIMF